MIKVLDRKLILIVFVVFMITTSGCEAEEFSEHELEDVYDDTYDEQDDADERTEDLGKVTQNVTLRTTHGDIFIGLFGEDAPLTVENFLRYVEEGFYDSTVFHRVVDGFMIQGGGFTADGNMKDTHASIENEADNGRRNLKGKLAMARTADPDSATSQFFINLENNPGLDHSSTDPGYAVFAKVLDGTDTVESIGSENTGLRYGMADWPDDDIVIEETIVH